MLKSPFTFGLPRLQSFMILPLQQQSFGPQLLIQALIFHLRPTWQVSLLPVSFLAPVFLTWFSPLLPLWPLAPVSGLPIRVSISLPLAFKALATLIMLFLRPIFTTLTPTEFFLLLLTFLFLAQALFSPVLLFTLLLQDEVSLLRQQLRPLAFVFLALLIEFWAILLQMQVFPFLFPPLQSLSFQPRQQPLPLTTILIFQPPLLQPQSSLFQRWLLPPQPPFFLSHILALIFRFLQPQLFLR